MGKSQREKDYASSERRAEASREARIQKIDAGSPEYNAWAKRIGERRSAIDRGDILGAPDFVGNKAGQEARNRQTKAQMTATPTGVAGIAHRYADPNELARNNQLINAVIGRDDAAQLEGDWRDYIGQTQAYENAIVGRRDNIDANILNQYSDQFGQYAQLRQNERQSRLSMMAGLVGAGLGGFGQVFSGAGRF